MSKPGDVAQSTKLTAEEEAVAKEKKVRIEESDSQGFNNNKEK